jgi:GYF domain 2
VVAWYCKIDDVEHGPLSQEELVKMAGEGRLAADDLVRNEQKKKWYKAGTVKGLKFPGDGRTQGRTNRQEPEPAVASTGTSAEAIRLLKGLTKKGAGSGTSVPTQSRPGAGDDWKPAPSAVMQKPPKKPFDPRTKKILWGAGAAILLLVLFPPHQVPDGRSMPPGWYFSPIFTPPMSRLKLDSGLGDVVSRKNEIVYKKDDAGNELKDSEGNRIPDYIRVPMPIQWSRLFLLCFAVIVVAAGAIGFLAARGAAAQVPDAKPAYPPRRKQV